MLKNDIASNAHPHLAERDGLVVQFIHQRHNNQQDYLDDEKRRRTHDQEDYLDAEKRRRVHDQEDYFDAEKRRRVQTWTRRRFSASR